MAGWPTRRRLGWTLPLAVLASSVGCDAGGSDQRPADRGAAIVQYEHDFGLGLGTWIGDTADYSPETAPLDAVIEIRPLPSPFRGAGLYLGGTNRSDDLLIYAKSAVDGFRPGGAYRVHIEVEFLTNAPGNCAGVGGAPGESVWILGGAATTEPLTVFDGTDYRVNIDRGNQATGGADAIVLGNIASPTDDDCSVDGYETKRLATPAPSSLLGRADAAGRIWLLLGLDSGYEASSHVFVRRLSVRFTYVA